MEMRTLGRTGLSVSALGLGCMGMSEFYGPSDEAQNLNTLARALELGINFLDTADMYGPHTNEELLGRFLKGQRDRVVLATKFAVIRSSDPGARNISNEPAYIRSACDASLRRLGIETIDLYYIHRIDKNVPIEDSVGTLAELVKAGKIRSIGLCEVSAATLRRATAVHPIAAVQSEYSLWCRDPEPEVLPACRELGVSFVAYSPLGRGALTGAFAKTEDLAPNDFRRVVPRFQGEAYDKNQALIASLKTLAEAKGCTPGQMALAWLLHQGQDVVPIPGTRRIERLEENAAATRIALTADELDRLNQIFTPDAVAGDRYPPVGMAMLNA